MKETPWQPIVIIDPVNGVEHNVGNALWSVQLELLESDVCSH